MRKLKTLQAINTVLGIVLLICFITVTAFNYRWQVSVSTLARGTGIFLISMLATCMLRCAYNLYRRDMYYAETAGKVVKPLNATMLGFITGTFGIVFSASGIVTLLGSVAQEISVIHNLSDIPTREIMELEREILALTIEAHGMVWQIGCIALGVVAITSTCLRIARRELVLQRKNRANKIIQFH